MKVEDIKIPLTNLDKVFWPKSGIRKYDLIDYYLQISDTILPYLKDRPQNLHRHPDGIEKDGFYQKNMEKQNLEPWVKTTSIYSKSTNENIEYLLCQNEATLLYLANLGCIELNPWNSRIKHLNKPDYAIIDLDPSNENSFDDVIEVAQAAKLVLDELKVKTYCKTSGATGLHIFFPLKAKYTYSRARDFTKILCEEINERIPKLTTLQRPLKKRNGRIYLDYLQNSKGQSIAATYCVRPVKNATVSAPLDWKEVKKGLKTEDFNITNMPKRIKEKGDLFKELNTDSINIETILKQLSDNK